MSKQIKVTDDVYRRIKGEADANYRSIGMQIEFLLDQYEGIGKYAPRTLGEHIKEDKPVGTYTTLEQLDLFNDTMTKEVPQLPRDKEILQEINRLSDIIKNADDSNQDPDYWLAMQAREKRVRELWEEWHEESPEGIPVRQRGGVSNDSAPVGI